MNIIRNKLFLLLFFAGIAVSSYYFLMFMGEYKIPHLVKKDLSLDAGIFMIVILLLMTAHYMRSWNSHLLICVIKETNVKPLFKALGIGFFFNIVLPFRIGEIIRAHVLGKELAVSRSVMFCTVLFERAIDAIIITTFSIPLILIGHLYGIPIHRNFYAITFNVFVIGVLVLYILYVFFRQKRWLLKTIYHVTGIFNDKLKNKIRYTMWSAIYGMNIIIGNAKIGRYVLQAALMWILYIGAIVFFVKKVAFTTNYIQALLIADAGYLSIVMPSGPGYFGTFHYNFSKISSLILTGGYPITLFSLVTWFTYIIPALIIGSVIFLLMGGKSGDKDNALRFNPKLYKLYREVDISNEFSYFLETYFSCSEISQIVNQIEIKGDFKLVETFKGGSNASTLLLSDKKENFIVRKIILSEYSGKLKKQAEWIKEKSGSAHFPDIINDGVIGNANGTSAYFYDMKYISNSTHFFDYIHSNPTENSEKMLDSILGFLKDTMYVNRQYVESRDDFDYYIDKKVLTKVRDVSLSDKEIKNLLQYDKLAINNIIYDNMPVVIEKLRSNENAMRELSCYYKSQVHGDLTVDNILITSNHDFILLDPNDENFISDLVVDMGKLYQSLHSGYEFLILLKNAEVSGNTIKFDENISFKYSTIYKYLSERLERELLPEQFRSIIFHEAVHYCRMLPYRLKLNRSTLPVFYAVAVQLFNEYLSQLSGKNQK